jgi:hypothetical protein
MKAYLDKANQKKRYYTVSAWNVNFLENFIIAHLAKKFSTFVKTEGSLSCLQKPNISFYSKPI